MTPTRTEVPDGLRARKRAHTRAALQKTALQLFGESGFDAVSVDEIATQANVSRSTFFRYFGSKEAVLLGEMEQSGELFLQQLLARPAHESPLKAFEAALVEVARDAANREVLEQQKQVGDLLRSDPALRGRRLAELERWADVLAQAFAERAGREHPELGDRLAASICLTISDQIGSALSQRKTAQVEVVMREAFEALKEL